MKTIKLSEALELKFNNSYHIDRLLKAKQTLDEINKYHSCEAYCEIIEKDNSEYCLENIKFYLINDTCRIEIRYLEYDKKYIIFYSESFKNLQHHQIQDIKSKFVQPKNIGVLNSKKINDWIEYNKNVYLEYKKKDKELANSVDDFLKSLEGENVIWFNNKTSGEIIKNGIKFTFKIENGYISKKIDIYYTVENSLEAFKKLSNNKYVS